MPKRMLIDASHPEETRVVVLDGQKVEEFDFEAASRRPLKGNIYLAKVTRVEPSLQAAFVEYGGNRQGFLAFSEIHPDYYQIPVADRMALIAEAEAEARRRQDDDVESFEIGSGPKAGATNAADETEDDEAPSPQVVEGTGEATDGEEVFSNHAGAGGLDDHDRDHDDDAREDDAHGDHDHEGDDRHVGAGGGSAFVTERGREFDDHDGEPDVADTEDGDEESSAAAELLGPTTEGDFAELSVNR